MELFRHANLEIISQFILARLLSEKKSQFLKFQNIWSSLPLRALPHEANGIHAANAVADRVVIQNARDIPYLGAR